MPWEIQFDKSTKSCQPCRHNFDIGEPYFSALFLKTAESKSTGLPDEVPAGTKAGRFERRDFCSKCWDTSPEAKTDVFSFWQTRILPKDTPKTPKEILLNFFDNLFSGVEGSAQVQSDIKPKVIYLFALILIRKRLLKLVQTAVRGNERILLLDRTTDAKRYEVAEITISDNELVSLRDEFGKLFEFKL